MRYAGRGVFFALFKSAAVQRHLWATMKASLKTTLRQVELTARRTLSFLSGGDLVPLLGDILYPSEKELLAERSVVWSYLWHASRQVPAGPRQDRRGRQDHAA